MSGPTIIDHFDDFEAEIAEVCRVNVILDRAVTRVLKAAQQRDEEWTDWYAEERASRTGSA